MAKNMTVEMEISSSGMTVVAARKLFITGTELEEIVRLKEEIWSAEKAEKDKTGRWPSLHIVLKGGLKRRGDGSYSFDDQIFDQINTVPAKELMVRMW